MNEIKISDNEELVLPQRPALHEFITDEMVRLEGWGKQANEAEWMVALSKTRDWIEGNHTEDGFLHLNVPVSRRKAMQECLNKLIEIREKKND